MQVENSEEAMKQTRDRIGDLPDSMLHCILSLLPMRSAVGTSVLSKRWRNLWKDVWVNLDFDEEFTNAQTPKQFVDIVDRCIHLHNGKKIESFRISFHLHGVHQANIEKWIEFTTSQGIKELDLYFGQGTTVREVDDPRGSLIKLPDFLFTCNSLIHLNLGLCEFNPPLDFSGFSSLETLQLKRIAITDKKLESVIISCPHLKTLALIQCFELESIRVVNPDLRLESLKVVDCWDTVEIVIIAPNLKSFHFFGDLLYAYIFEEVSALEDAFLSSEYFEHSEYDYLNILWGLSHIKILTICDGPLVYLSTLEEYIRDHLPITFPNLNELQLQIGLLNMEYLGFVYSFFKHTISPCLEKLFIEITSDIQGDTSTEQHLQISVEEPSCCVFNALRTIKIKNFKGREVEMKLVKFLLKKAILLESLVLVSPHNSYSGELNDNGKMESQVQSLPQSCQTQLRLLEDRLSSLPKESSGAKIILCEQGKDEKTFFPTHTERECYAELLN